MRNTLGRRGHVLQGGTVQGWAQVYIPLASTVVVAIATVVLVLLTGRYVRLTGRLAEESKRMRDPLVTVDFEIPDHRLRLVVANHGLTPARDVHVKLLKDTDWLTGRGAQEGLADARPIMTGVSFLAPGRKLKYEAGFPDWRNIPDGPIEVVMEVSYQSLSGESFSETIPYDFRQLHGILFESFKDSSAQVAEAIKRAEDSRRMDKPSRLMEMMARPATKHCIMCDEQILQNAKKCRHCGTMQVDAAQQAHPADEASE